MPSDVAFAIRDVLRANSEVTHSLARRLGIGITDATAMDHVLSNPDGLGPTELGHLLGIRSASATTLVDRLEAAGHVRRVPHPSDRRRQTVVATPQAYEEVLGALAPLFARVEEAVARLTPAQAQATAGLLREVAQAMRDYAGGRQAPAEEEGSNTARGAYASG